MNLCECNCFPKNIKTEYSSFKLEIPNSSKFILFALFIWKKKNSTDWVRQGSSLKNSIFPHSSMKFEKKKKLQEVCQRHVFRGEKKKFFPNNFFQSSREEEEEEVKKARVWFFQFEEFKKLPPGRLNILLLPPPPRRCSWKKERKNSLQIPITRRKTSVERNKRLTPQRERASESTPRNNFIAPCARATVKERKLKSSRGKGTQSKKHGREGREREKKAPHPKIVELLVRAALGELKIKHKRDPRGGRASDARIGKTPPRTEMKTEGSS